jgi:uncharacterized protein YggE
LADLALVTVRGPFWTLRPLSPHFHAARLEAVQDAVRRAKDYAAAVGSELIALLEMADEGLLGGGGSAGSWAPMSGRARGGGGDPVELDFTPEPQTVRGSVEMKFSMTRPELD